MYVLYLDESGSHGSEASCFVLAGLAAFEREIHWFSQDLDALQTEYFPNEIAPVHFHATKLHRRASQELEHPWNQLTVEQRQTIKVRLGGIISTRRGILFGCTVERQYAEARHEDAYERAFEDVVSRFDLFLARQNRFIAAEGGEEQRGIIVLAESGYQKTIALLAHRFQSTGTRWRQLHHITDVPFFAPAQDTRMLQFADFIANSLYGRYQSSLTGDFDRIVGKFDSEGGVIHGLAHLTLNSSCVCLPCFSRRGRQGSLGTPLT